jgi:alkaline phosphatase
MTMAYDTAEVGGSQAHTGTQLRIAGYGPRAANVIGLTDQTDLFFTILEGLCPDPTRPSAGPLVIERVKVNDGATLRGDTTIRVTLDTEAKYTYIELNQQGTWITDNTKEPGSTQAGRQPTLRLDTRKIPHGDYMLKIDAVADDGRTTELLIDITIRNR